MDGNEIHIRYQMDENDRLVSFENDVKVYDITKFTKTNQGTCINLKPIVAICEGKELLAAARVPVEEGVILVDDVLAASLPLRDALMAHRVWSRDARANQMPA